MVHQVQLVREVVGDQRGADSRPFGDLREACPCLADFVQRADGGLHDLLAPRFGDERPLSAVDDAPLLMDICRANAVRGIPARFGRKSLGTDRFSGALVD